MTEKNKHTPAPWRPETRKDVCGSDWPSDWPEERNTQTGWIKGPNGENVVEYEECGTHRPRWNKKEDFYLVLAAPELLEALENLTEWLDTQCPDHALRRQLIKDAISAIAKARGEQS